MLDNTDNTTTNNNTNYPSRHIQASGKANTGKIVALLGHYGNLTQAQLTIGAYNLKKELKTIAMEAIDKEDWEGLVSLLTSLNITAVMLPSRINRDDKLCKELYKAGIYLVCPVKLHELSCGRRPPFYVHDYPF